MHDIDNQNGNVTERRTTGSEVRERLVTRCIDNQETGDLELELAIRVDDGRLLSDGLDREVCSTDLLCDTTGFAFLDVGLSNLVQKFRLSGIDVTQNTANRGSQVVLGSGSQSSLVSLLTALSSLSLSLDLGLLGSCGGLVVLRLLLRLFGLFIVLGSRVGLSVGLLSLILGVSIPAILDIGVGGGSGLPVVINVTFSGSLLSLSLGLGLGLFAGGLLFSLLQSLLSLQSGALSSLSEGLLFVGLVTVSTTQIRETSDGSIPFVELGPSSSCLPACSWGPSLRPPRDQLGYQRPTSAGAFAHCGPSPPSEPW